MQGKRRLVRVFPKCNLLHKNGKSVPNSKGSSRKTQGAGERLALTLISTLLPPSFAGNVCIGIIRAAMEQATVDLLLKTIRETLQVAADNQLKVAAFERVLDAHNHSLCEAWRKEADKLRKQGGPNLEALATLREQLLRG